MIAVSFKKLAFLLLLLFQSRGRGRENTSPLLSFRLWSNSSDGHSGCPRQRLHMSVWLRIKALFLLIAEASLKIEILVEWKSFLSQSRRRYQCIKWGISHISVIIYQKVSFTVFQCTHYIRPHSAVPVQVNTEPFLVRWNAEQQLLYFYQWRPPCPKGRNCKQFEEVLTSSSPFLSSPTRFNPNLRLQRGTTETFVSSSPICNQHHVVQSLGNNIYNWPHLRYFMKDGVS